MSNFQPDLLLYCCLNQIGCSEYYEAFSENEIDLETFKLLTKEDLASIIPKLGPQRKVLQEIERLRLIDNVEQVPASQETKLTVQPKQNLAKAPESSQTQSPTVSTNGSKTAPNVNPNSGNPVTIANGTCITSSDQTSSISKTTGPLQNPITVEQEGLLKKYGINLPSAGDFATHIAVGTFQKFIIDKFTYPMTFGKLSSNPAATTGTDPKSEVETIEPTKLTVGKETTVEENGSTAGSVIENFTPPVTSTPALEMNTFAPTTPTLDSVMPRGDPAMAAAMEKFHQKYGTDITAGIQTQSLPNSALSAENIETTIGVDGSMDALGSGVGNVELLEEHGDMAAETVASGVTSVFDWFLT